MEKSLLCGNKKTSFVPTNGTKAVASAVPPILTPEIESVRLRHAQQRVRPDNGRPARLILLGRRKFLRRFAQPSRVHSSGGLRLHSHQRQLSVRGLPGLLLPVKGFCGCLICLHYRKAPGLCQACFEGFFGETGKIFIQIRILYRNITDFLSG